MTTNDEQLYHMLYHTKNPSAGCLLCIARHERNLDRWRNAEWRDKTRCLAIGQIVTKYERTDPTGGPVGGAWAKTICPECGKKVPATRPTKASPWVTIGSHKVKAATQ